MMISSCKDGQPMLRDWTGDWVGTFLGTLESLCPQAWLSAYRPLISPAATDILILRRH